jgi:hypothetical protein
LLQIYTTQDYFAKDTCALDECQDNSTTSRLLGFLAENIICIPSLKFFITGRPELRIRSGFLLKPIKSRTDTIVLHEIAADSVNRDIRLVLSTEL